MPSYVSFDPGSKRVGWAKFGEGGDVIAFGQTSFDNFPALLDEIDGTKLKHVICEDYRIFGHKAKAHSGSRVETIQCIGMIKQWMRKFGLNIDTDLTLQPSGILKVAEVQVGIKMPSNHAVSDQISALLHGGYWLIHHGLRKTALEMELESLNTEPRQGLN